MYLELKESDGFETTFFMLNNRNEYIGTLTQRVDLSVTVSISILCYGTKFDQTFVAANIKSAIEKSKELIKQFYVSQIILQRVDSNKMKAVNIYRNYIDPTANLRISVNAINKL